MAQLRLSRVELQIMETMWQHGRLAIRDAFLDAECEFGKHVVHGHTPRFAGADLRPFRTNLDTGAVWTGRLSVGVFDPDRTGGPVDVLVAA